MTDEKFKALYNAARNARAVTGNNLTERRTAQRHFNQAMDLLDMDCDANQYVMLGWAQSHDWPDFDTVLREAPV